MDEQELKRLEMRVKLGGGNEELDLVQLDALSSIIAEVRRLQAENERQSPATDVEWLDMRPYFLELSKKEK